MPRWIRFHGVLVVAAMGGMFFFRLGVARVLATLEVALLVPNTGRIKAICEVMLGKTHGGLISLGGRIFDSRVVMSSLERQ